MKIGNLTLNGVAALAPMAGQTSHALRQMAREFGDCGLVCTELLSSHAIHFRNAKTEKMVDWTPDERPFAVQIFGAQPERMRMAAEMAQEAGADIVLTYAALDLAARR